MSQQLTSRLRVSLVVGSLAAVAALAPVAAFAQASGSEVEVGGVSSSTAQPGGLPNTGGGPVAQTGSTIARPITLPNTGEGPGTDGLPIVLLAGAGIVIAGSGAFLRRKRVER